MLCYQDGTVALAGDLVALAHGAHSGVVVHVIDAAREVEAWGVEEAGLMIDTSYGGLVFHAKDQLTDDEVVLVSRAKQ